MCCNLLFTIHVNYDQYWQPRTVDTLDFPVVQVLCGGQDLVHDQVGGDVTIGFRWRLPGDEDATLQNLSLQLPRLRGHCKSSEVKYRHTIQQKWKGRGLNKPYNYHLFDIVKRFRVLIRVTYVGFINLIYQKKSNTPYYNQASPRILPPLISTPHFFYHQKTLSIILLFNPQSNLPPLLFGLFSSASMSFSCPSLAFFTCNSPKIYLPCPLNLSSTSPALQPQFKDPPLPFDSKSYLPPG